MRAVHVNQIFDLIGLDSVLKQTMHIKRNIPLEKWACYISRRSILLILPDKDF